MMFKPRKVHSGPSFKYKILTTVHKKMSFFQFLQITRKNGTSYGPKFILNMCNIWHFVFPQEIYSILFFPKKIYVIRLFICPLATQIIRYPSYIKNELNE